MAEYTDWATSSSPVDWDADIVDLDVLIGRPHRSAVVKGRAYELKHDDELSQVDQENLRRIFVRIFEIENAPGDDDTGLLRERDQVLLARLDERMCQIALHDVSAEDVAALQPQYRNAIRNLFYRRFDVTPYSTRMVTLWMERLREMQAATGEAPATTATPATSDSSLISTAPPKKARTSRRASASATKAA